MEEQLKKLEEEGASPMMAPPSEGAELSAAQKALWAASDAWSCAAIARGVAFSLGLLLSLCGHGCQLSYEHGLEIETFGKMQEMRQLRALTRREKKR